MSKGSQPGVIHAGEVYTLDEFRARLGLGKAAWASAVKSGLAVRRVGRRGFVRGCDAVEWLGSIGPSIAGYRVVL